MQCCYIGKGIVTARIYGVTTLHQDLGNVSKVELKPQSEEKTVKNYRTAGGGDACAISRITSVDVDLALNCLSAANIARALLGSSADVALDASEIVTVENVDTVGGGFIPAAPGFTVASVTNGAGTPVAWDLGTDYTVGTNGIYIVPDGDADGGKVVLTYAKPATSVIQLLTAAAAEYSIIIDGLNEMESGDPVLIELYRMKFAPASSFQLIGDDPAALEITGKLLADTTKTGGGISQYARITVTQ